MKWSLPTAALRWRPVPLGRVTASCRHLEGNLGQISASRGYLEVNLGHISAKGDARSVVMCGRMRMCGRMLCCASSRGRVLAAMATPAQWPGCTVDLTRPGLSRALVLTVAVGGVWRRRVQGGLCMHCPVPMCSCACSCTVHAAVRWVSMRVLSLLAAGARGRASARPRPGRLARSMARSG